MDGASKFNVFVYEDGKKAKWSSMDISNAQVGGRTAVDGDFTSKQVGLATDVTCKDPEAANLIVSGDVKATETQLKCGSAYVSKTSAVKNAPFFGQQGGRVISGDIKALTGVDLDAISKVLAGLRTDICYNKRKAIPAHVRPYGAIWFNGESAGDQYFEVDARDLNKANFIKFNVHNEDAAVIVAVKGDVPVTFGNLAVDNGCTDASHILFVFCSDHGVVLRNLQLNGSVLANQLTIKDSTIVGTIAAQKLSAERANFKPAAFCS